MTLVQIDLRRGRDPRPTPAASAAGVVVAAAAGPPRVAPSPAAVLGIGLVLLVALAEPALHSGPTLALLLAGLGVLGLIAVLLRPNAEVGPS